MDRNTQTTRQVHHPKACSNAYLVGFHQTPPARFALGLHDPTALRRWVNVITISVTTGAREQRKMQE
jgi:hypothetical protein